MTGTTPSLGPDASEPALSGEAKRDAAGEFLAEMKRQGYGYSDPQWLALMAALRKAAPVIARDALLSLAAELENRATHHLNPVRLTYSAAARMARDRAQGTPAQANATAPVSPDPHPDWPRTVAALVRDTGRQVAVYDVSLAYETGTLGIGRAEDPGRWLLAVRDVPREGQEAAEPASAPDVIAAAVAAERQRICAQLRRAAAGRREYAGREDDGSDARAILLKSAEHYESAVWLIEDPRNMLDVMPSWMWTDGENASLRGEQP